MALIFLGKSICAICGKILEKTDDVVAFPPFVDQQHRFAAISDAATHRACFESLPERDEVIKLLEEFEQQSGGRYPEV